MKDILMADLKATYHAAEAAWKAAQAAYEAQAAAAVDHQATLYAGCEGLIELAERADLLRAELAEIEVAQAAMHEASENSRV